MKVFRSMGPAAALFLAAFFLVSCSRETAAPRRAPVQGPRLALEVTPGPDYRSSIRFLIFTIPLYPQVACWLETEDGRFVQTVFVTTRGAKKSWYSAPARGRPEALPAWDHARAFAPAGSAAAGAGAGSLDAVSGATSPGAATRDASARDLPPGRYAAFLEVNRSYDYNEKYTRTNAGVNGQPSLVYRCDITVGPGTSTGVFEPMGTGSLDGSDGKITPGVEGLTTALTMLEKAQITYSPE